MTDFEIRRPPRQHIAAVRMTRPISEIGPAMGEAFPRLFAAVTAAGAEPAGMPLARYLEMTEGVATFECAIPVAEPFVPSDDIEAGTVGGGEAAFALHIGPYPELGTTWEALSEWVAGQGRTPAGPMWEVYLDDPTEVPEAELHTELYIPLA